MTCHSHSFFCRWTLTFQMTDVTWKALLNECALKINDNIFCAQSITVLEVYLDIIIKQKIYLMVYCHERNADINQILRDRWIIKKQLNLKNNVPIGKHEVILVFHNNPPVIHNYFMPSIVNFSLYLINVPVDPCCEHGMLERKDHFEIQLAAKFLRFSQHASRYKF